jgi:microcystin-dependent protein
MPVPTSRSDLNAAAGSNSPAGSEAVFPNLDNYLRAGFSFQKQNYDDILALQTALTARLPAGVITMWSGSVATIPSGWVICDGTNGTPDLRNRFIVGAGSTYAVGATGGSTAASTTSSNGAHTHTGTTGGHALTVAEMPAHTHTYRGATITGGGSDPDGSGTTFETGNTSSAGSGDAHTHTISSDGAHTHTVTTPLPPFYALCFIQKT